MTKGLKLGTGRTKEEVYEALGKVGFVPSKYSGMSLPSHPDVPGLLPQIHAPSYFWNVSGVVTEIEFDDASNAWPENPPAWQVLRRLYQELPDLVYKQLPDPFDPSISPNDYHVKDLSDLLG